MSKDIKITSSKSIITETTDLLNKYHEKLDELSEKATDYILAYDSYVNSNIIDADRLKDRMKMTVIKAVNNEL